MASQPGNVLILAHTENYHGKQQTAFLSKTKTDLGTMGNFIGLRKGEKEDVPPALEQPQLLNWTMTN